MGIFREANGTVHITDQAGNHYQGAKCLNPLKDDPTPIGLTIPRGAKKVASEIEVTGKVPHRIDSHGRFIRL